MLCRFAPCFITAQPARSPSRFRTGFNAPFRQRPETKTAAGERSPAASCNSLVGTGLIPKAADFFPLFDCRRSYRGLYLVEAHQIGGSGRFFQHVLAVQLRHAGVFLLFAKLRVAGANLLFAGSFGDAEAI